MANLPKLIFHATREEEIHNAWAASEQKELEKLLSRPKTHTKSSSDSSNDKFKWELKEQEEFDKLLATLDIQTKTKTPPTFEEVYKLINAHSPRGKELERILRLGHSNKPILKFTKTTTRNDLQREVRNIGKLLKADDINVSNYENTRIAMNFVNKDFERLVNKHFAKK